MADSQIHKPRPLSGYPEWLPEVRKVELEWIDRVRATFELYGFCSIETPAVEELSVLAAKGETADKEIYVINRLNSPAEEKSEAHLGLHYDLTVPLARYVAMNFGGLVFPFKRYQIQKVWRGERPQEGRFREFYQCDIDVINPEEVPLEYDAEIALIAYKILSQLGAGPVQIRLSNRKILQGYLSGLGIEDSTATIRIIDKLDKISKEGVAKSLVDQASLSSTQAEACLKIADIKSADIGFVDKVGELGVKSELLEQGLEELKLVVTELSKEIAKETDSQLLADLSIARGFDYYTGTVFEANLLDFPEFASVAAGGRYDDLASSYINRNIPGVGISIGLTRIFAKLLSEGRLNTDAKCPTQVLVTWITPESKEAMIEVADALRARGINTETFHTPDKLKKQIRYADRKGIPYVWFPPTEAGMKHEVKDMTNGEQNEVDLGSWSPHYLPQPPKAPGQNP